MLETSRKGLGAFLKALQGVGAVKNAPCPHSTIKVPRYSVSPSIKLISRRCDLRQECRSVQTTRANMFFRFGFFMVGLKFIFHNRTPNKTHKAAPGSSWWPRLTLSLRKSL